MIDLVEDQNGWKFAVVRGDTHIGTWAKQLKCIVVEKVVYTHILPLINEGDTVVDAGANIGDHTVAYAHKVGVAGRVIAFEPNLLTAACLLVNCRDTPQVKVRVEALGMGEGGLIPITADFSNLGASHISTGTGGDYFVKLTNLDSLKLQACHLIKLDIEGFEPEAIQGAWQTITKFRPKIVVELNDGALARYGYKKSNILDPLTKIGYKVMMLDETHNLSMPQVDVILLP